MCAAAPNPYRPIRRAPPASWSARYPIRPCAEERRGLQVGIPAGNREAEALVGDAQLREAAVEVVAGEAGPVAEVLLPALAVRADTARPAEPGDADSGTRREASGALEHLADDLVTGHEWQLRMRELAVEDVQVGTADAAREHPQERLA